MLHGADLGERTWGAHLCRGRRRSVFVYAERLDLTAALVVSFAHHLDWATAADGLTASGGMSTSWRWDAWADCAQLAEQRRNAGEECKSCQASTKEREDWRGQLMQQQTREKE